MPAALIATVVLCGNQYVGAVEPANVQIGPLYITPTVDFETFYTDNLWLTSEQEKDTWVGVLKPRVQTWLQNGPSDYSLSFELEDSTYADSSDDDFTDYTSNLDIHQEFNAKNTLNLFGEYYDGHEDRGTGFIEGDLSFFTEKPVEYDRTTTGGDYTYGSTESQGRVKLALKSVDYDYGNYREFTRFYDRTEDTLAGTFYWAIAQRTSAILEVRAMNNDYDTLDLTNPAGSRTNDEMNYLLGLVWEATAKTSGHVKLGSYDRQYDSSARSDENGFLWEVGVSYAPLTYSILDFQTRRFYQESNGLGDGINTEEARLGWDHSWNNRYSTVLKLSAISEDYEGIQRTDDTYGIEARFDYSFRRWMDLGAGYRYEDRDSNVGIFDYSGNIFFIEAKLSL